MNERHQLLIASALLAIACTLAFSPDAFVPMMARAFLCWWSIAFMGLALLALCKRAWWIAACSMVCAPMVWPTVAVPVVELSQEPSAHRMRVAHLNVLQPNMRHADAVRSIIESGADVVSVQEVGPEWASALREGLSEEYPHFIIVPRTNCYGIALFSKLPVAHAEPLQVAGTTMLHADVMVGEERVRVYAVHATSPGGFGQYRRRNAQLAELADRVSSHAGPVVVVGDLNTVHWDDAYRRLCARSGLRPVNPSSLVTWPSLGPLAFIPLDHALVTGGLLPSAINSFRIKGSDHRGIITDLHIAHAS